MEDATACPGAVQVPLIWPSPSAPLFRPCSGPPVRTAALPQSLAWLRLFSQFSSLPPSNITTTNPIPVGARTPWRPCIPMATAVTSLWARLTTPVRSLAVAKGTGGCRVRNGGNSGEGSDVDCQKHHLEWGGGSLTYPRGGRKGAAPSRRTRASRCLSSPLRPRNGLAREGAGRGATASAPPPDAPPSAPRSPRERGCCLGAAARGAGCRPRCCRWT